MDGIAWSAIFMIVFAAFVPFGNAQSLNGVWRSEGYGYIFERDKREARAVRVGASGSSLAVNGRSARWSGAYAGDCYEMGRIHN